MPPATESKAPSWTDPDGRLWVPKITVNVIARVKDHLPSVDLLDVFDGNVLHRIADDPCLLVNTLYLVHQPRAEELGLSDEEFGELLVGDTIEQAATALVEALCAFFPRGRRTVLKQLWTKLQTAQQRGINLVTSKIDSPIVEETIQRMIDQESEAIDQRLRSLGSGSGNSPASSASIPAP